MPHCRYQQTKHAGAEQTRKQQCCRGSSAEMHAGDQHKQSVAFTDDLREPPAGQP